MPIRFLPQLLYIFNSNNPIADPNSNPNKPNPEELEEKAMDPRDLVYRGGYRKHPREIVENPAITPEMLGEPEQTGAGYIWED